MLLFTNRQVESCAVVEEAFNAARQRRRANHARATATTATTTTTAGGSKGAPVALDTPFERRMYPYVLNNWLICQVRVLFFIRLRPLAFALRDYDLTLLPVCPRRWWW